VTDPSVPAVIQIVDVGLRSCFMAPASEPKLTNPENFQKAVRNLRVGRTKGPNRTPEQGFEASPKASGIPPGPDL
jgi:hypothetical protein